MVGAGKFIDTTCVCIPVEAVVVFAPTRCRLSHSPPLTCLWPVMSQTLARVVPSHSRGSLGYHVPVVRQARDNDAVRTRLSSAHPS